MTDEKSGFAGENVKGYADAFKTAYGLVKEMLADLRDVVDRQGARDRADITNELRLLRFEPEAFRKILGRIGTGDFKKSDLDQLEELLAKTASEVYNALYQINEVHRRQLEDRLGSEFWNKMEGNVQEMKGCIRNELEELSRMKSKSKAEITEKASRVEKLISTFNHNLATVCDHIDPPDRKVVG